MQQLQQQQKQQKKGLKRYTSLMTIEETVRRNLKRYYRGENRYGKMWSSEMAARVFLEEQEYQAPSLLVEVRKSKIPGVNGNGIFVKKHRFLREKLSSDVAPEKRHQYFDNKHVGGPYLKKGLIVAFNGGVIRNDHSKSGSGYSVDLSSTTTTTTAVTEAAAAAASANGGRLCLDAYPLKRREMEDQQQW